jgi:centromeric protein E
VRPLSKQEALEGNAWRIDGNTIYQSGDRQDTKYTLDHIFGSEYSTLQIYEQTTRSLIAKVVNGFNSTVFAYGQTSSGKTFTMRGSPQEPGLIPLAVHEVFHLIEASQDREYLIRVSYTEVGS